MNSLLMVSRSRSILESAPILDMPSLGGGVDSRMIDDRLKSMRKLVSGAVAELARVKDTRPHKLEPRDHLLTKLGAFKRITATVAMHLDRAWRGTLFATLDRLLDPDDWDAEFQIPSEQSFSTFLRMMIYLHPTRRPGIGLSPSGHFLAAWSRDNDRIVIECIGNDDVRWVLSRMVDGERESGAGRVLLHRVPEVTAPYEPEILLHNGDKILAG
jgi:hypothetical protein